MLSIFDHKLHTLPHLFIVRLHSNFASFVDLRTTAIHALVNT